MNNLITCINKRQGVLLDGFLLYLLLLCVCLLLMGFLRVSAMGVQCRKSVIVAIVSHRLISSWREKAFPQGALVLS